MTIALTTMAAASLAILVYIAVIITGTYYTQNTPSKLSVIPNVVIPSSKCFVQIF